jgi:hypothetical protein
LFFHCGVYLRRHIEGTVKIYVAKLFHKLGVHHRSAVALAGVKLGLRPSPMFP